MDKREGSLERSQKSQEDKYRKQVAELKRREDSLAELSLKNAKQIEAERDEISAERREMESKALNDSSLAEGQKKKLREQREALDADRKA